MENEQLFEFMTKMYSEIKQEFAEVKQEIAKTNMVIEHSIMPKIDSLYEANEIQSEKIDRLKDEQNKKLDELLNSSMDHTARLKNIEQSVVEHDEILFKHVK